MNAEEIRRMRDVLAAQLAATETRTPGLRRKLRALLTWKSPATSAPLARPSVSNASFDLDIAIIADPTPGDPIPPELLLGALAPRRPAFGQRMERVLELEAPMPVEPRRLILCAAGGEAVGEIILHPTGPALHAEEAPFFPEDLADEPSSRPKSKPSTARAQKAPPSPPELAATFLLANLAARLASEEAALAHRLTMAQGLSNAA